MQETLLGQKDLDSASYNDPTSYGYCEAPDTLSNGHIFYDIALNRDVLIKCSKEWVADTYLYELIHAYLGTQNWDFGNNTQHKTMAINYLDKMANTLKTLFPSLSLSDAYCISFSGLSFQDDGKLDYTQFVILTSVWRDRLKSLYPQLNSYNTQDLINKGAEYSEKGIAGTRMVNCN